MDRVLPQRNITTVKMLTKCSPVRFEVVVLVNLSFTPIVVRGWVSDLKRGFVRQTSIHQDEVLVGSAMSLLSSHTPDYEVTDPALIDSNIICRTGDFECFRNSFL